MKCLKDGTMPVDTTLATMSRKKSILEPLVHLFPEATAMRIPVLVALGAGEENAATEKTTIEFGTSRVVVFITGLSLEIDDRLHLQNADGSLSADAIVVGVQYQEPNRGVAAQFLGDVRNWIIQAEGRL
jgi:hypothetical protein